MSLPAAAPVVLLTDFGQRDWYAGTLKGVILSIAPDAAVLDLTHSIDPGDVAAAGFALEASYGFFPPGSIFCCVVDPGVGTERAGLCATDGRFFFVAPDNGLLARIARTAGTKFRAFRLENESFFLQPRSATFHGRDVFAPVSAHISRGARLEEFGPGFDPLTPAEHEASFDPDSGLVRGRVIYVDVYGNLFTNIKSEDLKALVNATPESLVLRVDTPAGPRELQGMADTFGAVGAGEPLFYPGSSGYIEIAVNLGRADDFFDVRTGAAVQISNNSTPGAL